MDQLKVMIVEDHPLMQTGIRKAIERCNDMRVVAEASTGKLAAEIADSVNPDIIIMDVRLPDSDGIDTMKSIKTRCKNTKVLMFSGFDDERYVIRALESGANGYLLKNIGGNELADAVRQTASGLNPVSSQFSGKTTPITSRKTQIYERLTSREKEVWQLLSSGAPNAEISKKLYISESTVKFHIRNIFHKLGVKNRVEAARIAFDSTIPR